MDAEENQRQVFLRAHSPWKSQTTRFPHSHSRCSAWKSGKPKAGFPLSHLLSLLFNQIKKGNPAADRFAPASRLILQLENARKAMGRRPRANEEDRSLTASAPELILNYYRAQKLISSGVVEGLNNQAKVTMRKSYGFRTYRVLELALYHSLGKLPEPESTRNFF